MTAGDGAVQVRPMTARDWPAVSAIYAEGIATGNATFETAPPSWETWDADHLPDQRLVAAIGEQVVGWVALAPSSGRCVYRGVAENSVYVAEQTRGRGIGRVLLEAIIESAEAVGIWTIETGIFPENHASIALHERAGFRVVGVRKRLGQLDGQWRDVVFLERRSQVV